MANWVKSLHYHQNCWGVCNKMYCRGGLIRFSFRHEELLKDVFAMRFDAPSKIQETALPTLLAEP